MDNSITTLLFITFFGVLCAVLITALMSLARTGVKEGASVTSESTTLVSSLENYDLMRLDGQTVSGKEVQRIMEEYSGIYNITVEKVGVTPSASVTKDAIYDKSNPAYINPTGEFIIQIEINSNDLIDKIIITERR